jgi:hypothetical protein
MTPKRGGNGLAAIVVLAILAGLLLVIIVSAFSQDNVPSSINGRTATTSHNLP